LSERTVYDAQVSLWWVVTEFERYLSMRWWWWISWFQNHNSKPGNWDDLEVLYLTYPNSTEKPNLTHLHKNLLCGKIYQKIKIAGQKNWTTKLQGSYSECHRLSSFSNRFNCRNGCNSVLSVSKSWQFIVYSAQPCLVNRLVIKIQFQPTKYLLRWSFSVSALLTASCADDTDVALWDK
jgi:hypothetical protein